MWFLWKISFYSAFVVWIVCPLVRAAVKQKFIFKSSLLSNYCLVLNTLVVQGRSPKPLGLLNITQALLESQVCLPWLPHDYSCSFRKIRYFPQKTESREYSSPSIQVLHSYSFTDENQKMLRNWNMLFNAYNSICLTIRKLSSVNIDM